MPTSRSPRARRRGVALPTAIGALVLLAALVATVALAARVEGRAGDASAAGVRARAAAEGALARELVAWDRARRLSLAIGAVDSVDHVVGGLPVRVRVARLRDDAWLAEAAAIAPTGLAGAEGRAERRARVDLRLVPLAARALGAVTSADSVHVDAGGTVSGADAAPPGWMACDPPADTVAIAASDAGAVVVDPAGAVAGGVVATAAAADPETWDVFGDEGWDALADRADVTTDGAVVRSPSPAAASDGRCTLGPSSWGEPLRGAAAACDGGHALVHARDAAPLALQGPARAQGVLLVDGDLEASGDVLFAGVVVVRGAVRLGGGARVLGALLARGPVTVSDGARVDFSRCAVRSALRGAARVAPLARRGWSY